MVSRYLKKSQLKSFSVIQLTEMYSQSAVPKSTSSGVVTGNSGNMTGGAAGSMTPMLSHQYIMGQAGVPYAAFQQPVYSYEDLQLVQQRIPHMVSCFSNNQFICFFMIHFSANASFMSN